MDTMTTQTNDPLFLHKTIENLFVAYPRMEAIISKISECHQSSKYTAEPKCLFIKGPSGAGKTTITKIFKTRYKKRVEDGTTIVPVLVATIPVPATVKSLATALLKGLGDPLAAKGSITVQTLRLIELIRECKVELILLDEFQNFIDRDSLVVLRTVSDWLKNLINETKLPVALFGMPNSEVIFFGERQIQLSRRFPYRMDLHAFHWDSPDNIQDFRSFLKKIDVNLPLPEASNLADSRMSFNLFYASDGIVNYVMKMIRSAAHAAVNRRLPLITDVLLAEAFQNEVKEILPHKLNPFIHTINSLNDVDETYQPCLPNLENQKKKKRNSISINQLLCAQ